MKEQKILTLFALLRAAQLYAEEVEGCLRQEFRDKYPFASIEHFNQDNPVFEISKVIGTAMSSLEKQDDPIVTDFQDQFLPWVKEVIEPKIVYYMTKNVKIK